MQVESKVTCLLRCIKSHFVDYSEDLATYEKYSVAFMSPIPFGYLGTLSIIKLAKQHPLGLIHVVSYEQLNGLHLFRELLLLNFGNYVRSLSLKKFECVITKD